MAIFLGILFILVCILLILVILVQKGRGGGLTAALGGLGSSAFGTKTGDAFTVITIVLTGLFLLVSVLASFAFRPDKGEIPRPVVAMSEGQVSDNAKVDVSEGEKVSVGSAMAGVSVHYTSDGSEVTENSPTVGADGTLTIGFGESGASRTFKLRSFRKGFNPSAVSTVTFTKKLPMTATPAFAPPGGTLDAAVKVAIICATQGAKIYYTLDGTEPTEASTLYANAVMVSPGTTLRARAFMDGYQMSEIAEAKYEQIGAAPAAPVAPVEPVAPAPAAPTEPVAPAAPVVPAEPAAPAPAEPAAPAPGPQGAAEITWSRLAA